MADCYHFGREYILWKLTYPQIHRYLDSRAKKQPPADQETAAFEKPVRATSLTNFGFSAG